MSVLCPECARLGCACFNCLQKAFTPHYTPPFGALPEPNRRYGIIPCRRCAFFVPGYPLPNGAVYGGLCARSQKAMDKTVDDGCGDGLLREEAAPLPPEREQEPKP